MEQNYKKMYIANPRGFCAGVDRAIDIVELALEMYGTPLYVKHAIVHNTHVVKDFLKKGVIFVENIKDIPEGSTVVYSAHGSSPKEFEFGRRRNLRIIDATCPLVTKVHLEVKRFSQLGYDIIMIGHKGHVEPVGTLGNAQTPSQTFLIENKTDAEALQLTQTEKLAVVTQTTLSVDETKEVLEILKQRFPQALFPQKEDICYATTNRQHAVKKMLPHIEALCVVGSNTSSNSNRLKELGERQGIPSYLVDDAASIDPLWFTDARAIGLTSGASVPEYLFHDVVAYFLEKGFVQADAPSASYEDVHFALPAELVKQARKHDRGKDIIEKHKIVTGKKMRV